MGNTRTSSEHIASIFKLAQSYFQQLIWSMSLLGPRTADGDNSLVEGAVDVDPSTLRPPPVSCGAPGPPVRSPSHAAFPSDLEDPSQVSAHFKSMLQEAVDTVPGDATVYPRNRPGLGNGTGLVIWDGGGLELEPRAKEILEALCSS
ncbi:hypothetical protein PsYK624_162690 [Phanerochaete sordida]|uniref:Uncharacterized protein n=1 Tax=Phanerochaete sordida TaxID=48140 RepID=A0A9P3GSG6_9APHY|nr:hypothetical protein PsYK624_162690 [Phanerochaete sordida]